MVSGEMLREIRRLKEERDAVVLAHYYVTPDAQDLADYVGDSFFLSRKAATLDCTTLVFAGVRFMAESAKLLSPGKTVPHARGPWPTAPWPTWCARRPSTERVPSTATIWPVACYVNSTTEMKAWSDVGVTSSNAVDIVRSLPQDNILFIPDMNLGHYVATKVPEKNVILNDGFCPTHESIDAAEVERARTEHPGALVLAHPECGLRWVLEKADVVGSTLAADRRGRTVRPRTSSSSAPCRV